MFMYLSLVFVNTHVHIRTLNMNRLIKNVHSNLRLGSGWCIR